MRRKIATLLFILCGSTLYGQKTYTFVFLNTKPDKKELPKDEAQRIMQGHLDNINRLAKEGKLLIAGPFEGGGGIFVLNTPSTTEATEWLSTDPGVKAERWNIELLPFKVSIGSLCTVDDSAKMVAYHFIRYTSEVAKSTVQQSSETLRKHNEYVKKLEGTGNVIASGVFGDGAGSILIMQGELDENVLRSDPAVENSLLNFQIKKLWIAKGSFCEK